VPHPPRRNVLAKVPVEHQAEVKKAFWSLFDDTGATPGDPAIAVVRERAERFAATYAKRSPAAVDCLTADFATLTTYLPFPAGHHARIRHSNFIERTFGEHPAVNRGSCGVYCAYPRGPPTPLGTGRFADRVRNPPLTSTFTVGEGGLELRSEAF
jgi:hypothetical protein